MKNFDMKNRQIQEAVRRMELFGIDENAIREFQESGTLNVTQRNGELHWLSHFEKGFINIFIDNFKEFVVFHLIHTKSIAYEGYEILFVPPTPESWNDEVIASKDETTDTDFLVISYNIDVTNPVRSDLKPIGIKSFKEGVIRTT